MSLLRYVLIAMEALDQLLMACHSQSIKPFVESFLHMVAKLLESGEPKLQVLGTNSVSKLRVLKLWCKPGVSRQFRTRAIFTDFLVENLVEKKSMDKI